MINSVIAQKIKGNKAYDYEVGNLWSFYNVEQQAHLVEDWYQLESRSPAGSRYPYVRDYIRHPRRSWLIETALDVVLLISVWIAPSPPAAFGKDRTESGVRPSAMKLLTTKTASPIGRRFVGRMAAQCVSVRRRGGFRRYAADAIRHCDQR